VERIGRLDERVDHGSHPFIVLAKDGLKHGEIEVGHFEHNFVEDLNIGGVLRVFVDVKKRCL
jgi:hypothetical protein